MNDLCGGINIITPAFIEMPAKHNLSGQYNTPLEQFVNIK